MLTEEQKQSLCEVYAGLMEESEVHEIIVEHLREWLTDFDEEELEEMYAKRVGNE